jgi:hypothetical protein
MNPMRLHPARRLSYLDAWYRVLFLKVIIIQVIKKLLAFMEPLKVGSQGP